MHVFEHQSSVQESKEHTTIYARIFVASMFCQCYMPVRVLEHGVLHARLPSFSLVDLLAEAACARTLKSIEDPHWGTLALVCFIRTLWQPLQLVAHTVRPEAATS